MKPRTLYPIKYQLLLTAATLMVGIAFFTIFIVHLAILIVIQLLLGVLTTTGNVYNIFAIKNRALRRRLATEERRRLHTSAQVIQREMLRAGELIPRDKEEMAIADAAKQEPAELPPPGPDVRVWSEDADLYIGETGPGSRCPKCGSPNWWGISKGMRCTSCGLTLPERRLKPPVSDSDIWIIRPAPHRHRWHKWEKVRDTGLNVYSECRKCHKRRVTQPYGSRGYQPIDRQWLEGGDWTDVAKSFTPPPPPPLAGSPFTLDLALIGTEESPPPPGIWKNIITKTPICPRCGSDIHDDPFRDPTKYRCGVCGKVW